MSWLTDLVRQHEDLEAPLSFWMWSGLAAISAVVKDNVWLNRQIYNLYPNIYVMLHAKSGLKKGPPISMARQLVSAIDGMTVISGRSSVQGILKEMGTGQTAPGGKIINKNKAFICSSELTSSIVDDPVATKILTDLYDRNYNVGNWRSLLKMESFDLKDPTITMLTATNEAMSEGFLTKSAMQGGYFARTFIVYESKRNKINSLTAPLLNPPNYKTSSDYLRELSKLRGEFQQLASLENSVAFCNPKTKGNRTIYFSNAGLLYDDWYDSFIDNIDKQEIEDDTGTLNRFGDSVLKVALLISLSEAPKLEISESAMTEALRLCEKLLGNIRKTTLGKQGISNQAVLKTMIINELLDRPTHQVTRQILMRKMWMHYGDISEFDDVMNSFDHAGMIKMQAIGDNILYTMPPTEAEQMKRFMEGKNK